MGEFSKFSIEELNTAIAIVSEAQKKVSPGLSLQDVKNLMNDEISSRISLSSISSIEDLKNKYLGKYVGYKGASQIIYFRIDNIEHIEDIDVVKIETKLAICQEEDGWVYIEYVPDYTSICNLSPKNLDMRDFFYINEEEFKEKLNKIITNGTA